MEFFKKIGEHFAYRITVPFDVDVDVHNEQGKVGVLPAGKLLFMHTVEEPLHIVTESTTGPPILLHKGVQPEMQTIALVKRNRRNTVLEVTFCCDVKEVEMFRVEGSTLHPLTVLQTKGRSTQFLVEFDTVCLQAKVDGEYTPILTFSC